MYYQNYSEAKNSFSFKGLLIPLMLLISLFICLMIGTEYIAIRLGIPPGPYLGLENPFKVFVWAVQSFSHEEYQAVIVHGMTISFGCLLLSYFVIYILFYVDKYRFQVTDIMGSARFATFEEIVKMGYLNKVGLYIGSIINKKVTKYLRVLSDCHVLMVAPTRSGKGTGGVIPNLLTHIGSVVCYDHKGENYLLTSMRRKKDLNNNVIAFYPSNMGGIVEKFKFRVKDKNGDEIIKKLINRGYLKEVSANAVCLAKMEFKRREEVPELIDPKFEELWHSLQQILFGETGFINPLDTIRMGQSEVRDTQFILGYLVEASKDNKLNHWEDAAKTLLLGVILHCLYACKTKNMNTVLALISTKNKHELFQCMLNTIHDPDGEFGWVDVLTGKPTQTHPTVAQISASFLDKREDEVKDVFSTAERSLEIFRDPVVSKWTSKSSFAISDLLRGDRPLSLYLIVPPNDKERLRPLLRLIINILTSRMMENVGIDPQNLNQHKFKTLFVLDEFASLGGMTNFEENLSIFAGYGIRCLIILQDLAQLKKNYGEHNTIFSQCDITIVYATKSIETAKNISIALGETTQSKLSKSYASTNYNSSNESVTETKRLLLDPSEITRLKSDELLILPGGNRPIRGKKIIYYTNPAFKKMVYSNPVPKSDNLNFQNDFNYLLDKVVEYKPDDNETKKEEQKPESVKQNYIKLSDLL